MTIQARAVIAILRHDLAEVWKRAHESGDSTAGFQRAERWHERAVRELAEKVSKTEAAKLRETDSAILIGDPLGNLQRAIGAWDAFLAALSEELGRDPGYLEREPATPAGTQGTVGDSRRVFVVHGHDDANLLRLQSLLRDRFKLEPVIMRGAAGRGRALIEKFEELASTCGFAFVLLTPDDQVATASGQFTQARPNVVFELGWFYGRLGRSNVVMLLKEGTRVHSDLDGVSRIEFSKSVEEKYLEIEQELVEAGLLTTAT